jgi:DNA-binding transcriptional LysR family regulator
MELRQLEYLVAVADEANFTRAAERLRVSQPGVSAQIRQLERELGAELIDRSGRTATLTTAGEAALKHARAALGSVLAVRQAVDEVTSVVRGRLRIGMVTACTVTPLFDALAKFHSAHPGVEIALIEDNSDRLIDRVRAGLLDLALVATAGAPPAELHSLSIVSDGLVAAVPPDHPLAGRPRTTLADVAAYPVICLPKGTGIRAVFDLACAEAGLLAEIALQASAPDAIANLAARGLGVAVLSESVVTGDRGLTALVIEDVAIPAVLALVWTATSPALGELLVRCRAAFMPAQPG